MRFDSWLIKLTTGKDSFYKGIFILIPSLLFPYHAYPRRSGYLIVLCVRITPDWCINIFLTHVIAVNGIDQLMFRLMYSQ